MSAKPNGEYPSQKTPTGVLVNKPDSAVLAKSALNFAPHGN